MASVTSGSSFGCHGSRHLSNPRLSSPHPSHLSYTIGDREAVVQQLPRVARVAAFTAGHGEDFAKACLFFSAGFLAAALCYVKEPFSHQNSGAYRSVLVIVAAVLFLVAGRLDRLHRAQIGRKCALGIVALVAACAGVVYGEFLLSGRNEFVLIIRFSCFVVGAAIVFLTHHLVACCRDRCQNARSPALAAGDGVTGLLGAQSCAAAEISLRDMSEVRNRLYRQGDLHHRLDLMSYDQVSHATQNFLDEVHTRGRMFEHFAFKVRRSLTRRLTLTSVWDFMLGQGRGLSKHIWVLWFVCLLFWYHVWQIAWEMLLFLHMQLSLFLSGLILCFLACVVVIYETRRCSTLMSMDVQKIRDWQWEDHTKGFAGFGQNACVVSMSGRSKSLWFGIKGSCAEQGIGFACLWEPDWGDLWWPRWLENVREYGTERLGPRGAVPLILLIDVELRNDSNIEKASTLLGKAQQLEVAYLLERNIDFVTLTNEEFVRFVKEKALGSSTPLPTNVCVERLPGPP